MSDPVLSPSRDWIVFFDFETTGLSPTRSRIVQIGAVRENPVSGEQEKFSELVDPEEPIPEGAAMVHGITDDMIRTRRPPPFRDIADRFVMFLGQHAIGGHNLLRYDLPLLQAELVRAGRSPIDITTRPCIDTLVIFRHVAPGIPHSLAAAMRFYAPAKDESGWRLHDALGDAHASLEVFGCQRQRHPDLLSTLAAAADLSAKPLLRSAKLHDVKDANDVLPFGRHKGKTIKNVNPDYLRWMLDTIVPEALPSGLADRIMIVLSETRDAKRRKIAQ